MIEKKNEKSVKDLFKFKGSMGLIRIIHPDTEHPVYFKHHVNKDGTRVENPCCHPMCIVRDVMES